MLKLTDAEWDVMKQIWKSSEPVVLSEIIEKLGDDGIFWKPNTIRTFLVRLEKKGAIEVLHEYRPFKYRQKISREQCEVDVVNKISKNIFNGSISRFVSALLASHRITDREYEELTKIIANYNEGCGKDK
jgi:BlaI family penicillinase repressor